MQVHVYTVNDGELEIRSMPDEDVMALVDEWCNGDAQVLTFSLDDSAVAHVARRHIVRVDIDEEDAE